MTASILSPLHAQGASIVGKETRVNRNFSCYPPVLEQVGHKQSDSLPRRTPASSNVPEPNGMMLLGSGVVPLLLSYPTPGASICAQGEQVCAVELLTSTGTSATGRQRMITLPRNMEVLADAVIVNPVLAPGEQH